VPSATRANLGAEPPKKPSKPVKTPEMEAKTRLRSRRMLYSRMLDELLTKSEDVGKTFPPKPARSFYREFPGARDPRPGDRRRA